MLCTIICLQIGQIALLLFLQFQTLLRHGANPDLRDEDGKTPLDKARERNDEGHREVIQILQSPGQNMLHLLKHVAHVKNISS